MSKYIPVEPEKWAEMVKAMAEVTRLNAVIESHKDAGLRILAMLDEERRNTSHLKAEVERLEQQVKYWRIEAETDHARWLRVLEGVERLRKAGDALQKRLYVLENPTHPEVYLKLLSAWNAAKEGKQP